MADQFFTQDRSNVNETITFLTSAARTASNSTTFERRNYFYRGVMILWDITAIGGAAPSVETKIRAWNKEAGVVYDMLVSPPQTAISKVQMILYPGINTIPGLAASSHLPLEWGIKMEHANADSITYSVHYKLLV